MPSKLAMLMGACCGQATANESPIVSGSGSPLDYTQAEPDVLLQDRYTADRGYLPSVVTIPSGYDSLLMPSFLNDLGLQPLETIETNGEAREAQWTIRKSS